MKGQEILDDAYHNLSAFYSYAHTPRNADDIQNKEGWIIAKDEREAISKVLAVLADCGAETHLD